MILLSISTFAIITALVRLHCGDVRVRDEQRGAYRRR